MRVKERPESALLSKGCCPIIMDASAVATACLERCHDSVSGAMSCQPKPVVSGYHDGCYTLSVPQGRAGVRVAASGRPSGSHTIRLAWWHLELLSGGPVRYEGRAVGA